MFGKRKYISFFLCHPLICPIYEEKYFNGDITINAILRIWSCNVGKHQGLIAAALTVLYKRVGYLCIAVRLRQINFQFSLMNDKSLFLF